MSSAMIHYGAPPNDRQTVSEALRLRGINLVKSTVRAAEPAGIRLVPSPSYEIYKENLHVAMATALGKAPLVVGQNRFKMLTSKKDFEGMSRFRVVWDYVDAEPPLDATAMDRVKAMYNPSELTINGKPCLQADLSIASVAELTKSNSPASTTTPTVANTINLSAAKALIRISRIAMAFLLTHQYPLASTGTAQGAIYSTFFMMGTAGTKENKITADWAGTNEERKVFEIGAPNADNHVYYMNGLVDPDTYSPYVRNSSQLHNNSGFLFPFVAELCKEDDNTVPEIIQQYFFNCLANDAETATGVMDLIKSGWGVIKQTYQGDVMAHLFSGIKLAIETGATIRVLYTTVYGGFQLAGTGFSLVHRGDLIDPVSFDDLQASFDEAAPGSNAMAAIINLLSFDDPMEKTTTLQTPPATIHQLRHLIVSKGYNTNKEQEIRQHALHLAFPNTSYLAINSHNISMILRAMTQPESGDTNYPMHPLYLLSTVRNHRLWSAFGEHAPTFLIPGGRVIGLTGSFSYKERARAGKTKIDHEVSKMHIQVVPVAKAMKDLDIVLSSKEVHSPVGTPIMKKASTQSVFREYTGNSATEILGALRLAAGITVVASGSGGKGKGKRSGSPSGGANKKKKLDDAMEI